MVPRSKIQRMEGILTNRFSMAVICAKQTRPTQRLLRFTVPKPAGQGKGLDIDITMHPTSGDPDFIVARQEDSEANFDVIAKADNFAGIERVRLSAAEIPAGTMLVAVIYARSPKSRFTLSIEAYPAEVMIAPADLSVRICCSRMTVPNIVHSSLKKLVICLLKMKMPALVALARGTACCT
jgi:hypothetical protein